MQSARVLSLRTAVNVLYASLRHKSGAKSQVSVAQQGRIFRNLLGNRIKGSKKRWYPAQDADKFGRSEAHTPSISVARPQTSQKHNNRRVSVLNKLFMTNITDFLATSEISESIVGRGMQVSYVNVTSDFSQVNVYWLAQGDEESNLMLEQELFRCSGQLQHELSQLRLMGEVPRIRFHRDKTGKTLQQVQSLLSKIGEIERLEEAPSEESQEAVADSTENKTSPASWPKMRQDVMNLNRQLIMDKIFIKMRKSREAWASYSREPKPT
ncbi:hypothetical protein KR018_003284, partial [Drosophila ironensis]